VGGCEGGVCGRSVWEDVREGWCEEGVCVRL
jgi:hypothetical protein